MAKRMNEVSYIAVRWPRQLRQPLKVAAASADPPMTMTEYLQECFERIQSRGGLDAVKREAGKKEKANR